MLFSISSSMDTFFQYNQTRPYQKTAIFYGIQDRLSLFLTQQNSSTTTLHPKPISTFGAINSAPIILFAFQSTRNNLQAPCYTIAVANTALNTVLASHRQESTQKQENSSPLPRLQWAPRVDRFHLSRYPPPPPPPKPLLPRHYMIGI